MSATERAPVPQIDDDSRPFWAALDEGRVIVQICAACGRQRFPRLGYCPWCATPGGDDLEVTGTGVVYSFVRAHRALTEAMVDEVPYAVATITLDGGARMLGRTEPPEAVEIGASVEPFFVAHEQWTELRFRIASTSTESINEIGEAADLSCADDAAASRS